MNCVGTLIESLAKQSTVMASICNIAPASRADVRDNEVKKITIRVSELIRGASTLGPSQNVTSLGILARQVLESLITLLWLITDKDNGQKYIDASDFGFQRAAKLNMEAGLLKVYSREEKSDKTPEFLGKKFKGKIPRAPSIEQQAREAGVLDLYTVLYRFMSLDVHGKTETVIEEKQMKSDTIMHLQGIEALSMAVGHSATLWFVHREKVSNETLRKLMGLNKE